MVWLNLIHYKKFTRIRSYSTCGALRTPVDQPMYHVCSHVQLRNGSMFSFEVRFCDQTLFQKAKGA